MLYNIIVSESSMFFYIWLYNCDYDMYDWYVITYNSHVWYYAIL